MEETRGMGDGREWKVSHNEQAEDAGAAEAAADRLAREYVPAYPWSARSRRVIRLGEQSFLVMVDGLTSSFHFRVHWGELAYEG